MLFQLGSLTLDVAPFNPHESTRESGYDFAAKDIVGAQRPREAMGESDEKRVFHCRLFPRFSGGLGELDILDAMRASGEPQMLIRGDGAALGWFFVDHVHEQSEYLSASGVGNQINVTIDLVKSPDAASAESMLSMLMGLFE